MDNIKLSFGDKKNYQWIVKNNTIVCNIECNINIPVDYYNAHVRTLERLFPKIDFYYDLIRFTVKGVAKCAPEDKYDEVLGKHIAEAKAKQKAYSIAYRIFNYISNAIDDDMNSMDMFISDMFYQKGHELEHIEFLTTQG